ncbi:hypothetical protein ACFVT2_15475 [Streptomyces sp. NPDC058000]|uniref:hypothetical protein n=1 Tax=Streptomyces sp. NPDC058000 TaxID=3346299 RepID=UPI0036E88616
MSPTQTPERVELGKFFMVSVGEFEKGHATPEMFSAAIDAEWHRLLGSPEYVEFSSRHAGQPLEHVSSCGTGRVSWIATYEKLFGPLPDIWFTDADGTVNHEAAARYRKTGEVWAAWNCSPAPGDPETVPQPQKVTIR